MRLTFYGGAGHVTGANYLLEAGGKRILVDCGMVQGSRYNDEMNYPAFPYDVSTIDALFVTHSHADHIGRIPKLYHEGFRGVIYASEPTAAIVAVALPDTLDKVISEAREYGVPPLWDSHDMEEALALFHTVKYDQHIELSPHLTVTPRDSGHVLGSTTWEFAVQEGDTTKRIAFPGDIGNSPSLLLHDIEYVHGVDYTLVESAYGNRIHEAREQRRSMLLDAIQRTHREGGVLMIPSFAIERTQELLLEMDTLFEAGQLPKMPVFVDSPLAIAITKVYSEYSSYFNPQAREILKDNRGIFQFPWLTFTPTVAESKHINDVPAPKIIIAGAGMCQGGRIVHHLSRYLPDSRNQVLFIGYQVQGSLGRRIRDHAPEVHILGHAVSVRAQVQSIGAYSAHADQNGLIEYIRQASLPAEASAKEGNLKRCFVVQGEPDAAAALAKRAHDELGVDAVVPQLGESFEL